MIKSGIESAGILLSRPAVSEKRVTLTAKGNVRYQLKTPDRDGTKHVIFEPLGKPKKKRPNVTSPFSERRAMEGRAGVSLELASCAMDGYVVDGKRAWIARGPKPRVNLTHFHMGVRTREPSTVRG